MNPQRLLPGALNSVASTANGGVKIMLSYNMHLKSIQFEFWGQLWLNSAAVVPHIVKNCRTKAL